MAQGVAQGTQGAGMSIEALIEAARYLDESNDSGHEDSARSRRANRYRSKKPSTYSRTTHNLLEKNRRAQLRDCLEVLRQHVPLPDKLTTLALLQSAKKYIENLQTKEKEDSERKRKLQREQTALLSRLTELGAASAILKSSSPPTSPLSPYPLSPETSSEGSKGEGRDPPTPDGKTPEEEENMVIDVLTHDSEDEASSTTSGSDGGCTATSHKYEIAV